MIGVIVFTETLSRIGGGPGGEGRGGEGRGGEGGSTADSLRSWAYLRVQGI